MLKINTDMNFKSLSPICSVSDPVGERIRSEYDILRAEFTPEELLHLVTEPAELFLQEGNISNFINDTSIRNVQNVKVDVVNNLLNRLMMYSSGELNYRDTVYIESALHKLGITNVQNFMKQVNRLQTEENQTKQLINIYGDNINELRTVVNEAIREQQTIVKGTAEEEEKPSEAYYIHNEIYDRLGTADIYNEMSLIYQQVPGREEDVLPNEMAVAEQMKVSENIILNKLQNYVREESTPITYRTYNIYESGDNINVDATKRDVVENMVSAVLLNQMDKAYQIYTKNYSKNRDYWYDFSKTFYSSAENTFKRMQEIRKSGDTTFHLSEKTIENTREIRDREIELLSEIVHYTHETESITAEKQSELGRTQITNNNYNTTENTYEQNIDRSNTSVTMENEVELTNIENQNLTREEYEEKQEIEMKQMLDIINQQNLEKLALLQEQQTLLQKNIHNQSINRERAKRDSLRFLEGDEAAQIEYLQAESPEVAAREIYEKSVENLMTEETKEILRLVDEYRNNPVGTLIHSGRKDIDPGKLVRELEYINKFSESAPEQAPAQEPAFAEAEMITEEVVMPSLKKEINRHEQQRRIENVDLVHKVTEQVTDNEELIEELKRQNTELKKTHETTTTQEVNEQHKAVEVFNFNNTTTTQINSDNIAEYVKDGVRNSMDAISEQVFNKLEKKLSAERKRRGF